MYPNAVRELRQSRCSARVPCDTCCLLLAGLVGTLSPRLFYLLGLRPPSALVYPGTVSQLGSFPANEASRCAAAAHQELGLAILELRCCRAFARAFPLRVQTGQEGGVKILRAFTPFSAELHSKNCSVI